MKDLTLHQVLHQVETKKNRPKQVLMKFLNIVKCVGYVKKYPNLWNAFKTVFMKSMTVLIAYLRKEKWKTKS